MAIVNPYSLVEHRTFRRTFLRQTEVIVKFAPAIPDAKFRSKIAPYLKNVFNIDFAEEGNSNVNHVEVGSENEQQLFVFDLDQAKILIGPNCYSTFSNSVIPLIGKLIQFIQEVATAECVERLSVVKINVWPFESENASSDILKMVRYTFSEKCVSNMFPDEEHPESQKYQNITYTLFVEDMTLYAIASAEMVDTNRADLSLVLDASSTDNVAVSDILSDVMTLNDAVYQGFMDAVSDNIINFMSRENLS